MPPHYDPRRQYERPIPSLHASATSDASDADANAGARGDIDQRNLSGANFDETNGDVESDVDNELVEDAHSTDENSVGNLDETNGDFEAEVENELVGETHSTDVNNSTVAFFSSNESSTSSVRDMNANDSEITEMNDDVQTDVDSELAENAHDGNSIVGTEQNETVSELNDSHVNGGESNIISDSDADIHAPQSTQDVETDAKQILQPVNMHADDEAAIKSLFVDSEKSIEDDDDNDPSPNSNETISLRCGETAEVKDGKIVVTRKLDDSLEMQYIYGETPTPRNPQYVVKMNDPISGNIPFKENAENDRAYLTRIDKKYEEIKMASVLVNGLKCMNEGDYRKQSTLDHAFVKMLIIGLCTKDAIKNGKQIHKDLKIFMKGLYIFVNCIFR